MWWFRPRSVRAGTPESHGFHRIQALWSLTIVSTVLGLLPFLSDGPEEVFWFDFAIGTIAGMAFSVLALILVLPVFCIKK